MCQEVNSIYGHHSPKITLHILLQGLCIKAFFLHSISRKANLQLYTKFSTSATKDFYCEVRACWHPAGITSKMLGDRTHPITTTTTDPFASLSRFPHPSKMQPTDNDDRSSISTSDNDDSCSVQLSNEKLLLKGGHLPPGKKTRGRVKIEMQYIQNKLRRYTTFSKRKSGIMKKVSSNLKLVQLAYMFYTLATIMFYTLYTLLQAYELSTLTGTQVMLLVASETGHVYTFATPKLQPMITSEAGKALIQTCLHQPDPHNASMGEYDMRMSATGFEETELGYQLPEDADFKVNFATIHACSRARVADLFVIV